MIMKIANSLPSRILTNAELSSIFPEWTEEKIFAKTGTVTGVCTLAGYAQAANGHTLAFVMLNSGLPKASPVRVWQDKVCDLLCR